VPAIIPMNSASEISTRVPGPRATVPMMRIAPTGRRATTDVLIERTIVWLTARFTYSAKV
jgi:hypothetical protein